MANAPDKQPTYLRQRFLLSFVRQFDEGISATDLQKLVFLYLMEHELNYYEFVPYKYGSYSFQLKEDLDILQKDEFIFLTHQNNRTNIRAVDKTFTSQIIYSIASERGDDLIRKAYRKYPYYAINSEITSRLFCGEELECFNNTKKSFSQTKQVLFTIGYEGKTIEAFINTLIKNDIRVLCDVRKNPLSRKFGFSKEKLKHITENVGIKYIGIPALGIESDKRTQLNTEEDYHKLFADYEKTLPARRVALNNVYELLYKNNRIALMCYERDPQMCHRHIIRDYINKTYNTKSEDI